MYTRASPDVPPKYLLTHGAVGAKMADRRRDTTLHYHTTTTYLTDNLAHLRLLLYYVYLPTVLGPCDPTQQLITGTRLRCRRRSVGQVRATSGKAGWEWVGDFSGPARLAGWLLSWTGQNCCCWRERQRQSHHMPPSADGLM